MRYITTNNTKSWAITCMRTFTNWYPTVFVAPIEDTEDSHSTIQRFIYRTGKRRAAVFWPAVRIISENSSWDLQAFFLFADSILTVKINLNCLDGARMLVAARIQRSVILNNTNETIWCCLCRKDFLDSGDLLHRLAWQSLAHISLNQLSCRPKKKRCLGTIFKIWDFIGYGKHHKASGENLV